MSGAAPSSIAHWAALWRLTPDGTPIRTRSGRLLPVRTGDGELAMLKVSAEPEEQTGTALLAWWDGDGAARILEQEDDAILLERATGFRSLSDMAKTGEDEEATRILCGAVAKLHAPRSDKPPEDLVPLDRWFSSLLREGDAHGGLLARCAASARALLDDPRDVRPLHGDIHHGNVLDFGSRGWLAIDPKGLIGERGFDYANLFCNPDHETALEPGRLRARLVGVATCANIDRGRLLKWVLAWSGLSAVWQVEDGDTAELDLSVVETIAAVDS